MSAAPPRGATSGFALHLDGLRLLRRERSLWRLAAVPFVLCLLAVVLTLIGLVQFADSLYGWAAGWLPEPVASVWYEWLWLGPLRAGLWLLGLLLFLALCGAAVIAAWLVAGVVAAPCHDVLSRRVEELVTGSVEDRSAPGTWGVLREGGRAVAEELRRLVFFAGIQASIFVVGVLLPGGQLLAPPAMTLFAVLFLPLDYASYALDRRRLSFREKRRWVMAHRRVMLGFGAAAFLTFLVPGLNLLAMPVLVVSGTLLVLRAPVPGAEPAVAC